MKIIFVILCFISYPCLAGVPKTIEKVNYVYVLDVEKSFDFSAGPSHECGSNLYRTSAATEDITNRKFSLVLTAYTAGKRLTINTEGCTGNRMKFGWVRVHD